MRRALLVLAALAILATVLAAVFAVRMAAWLGTPIAALEGPMTFEIERGATLTSVATRLQALGFIEHPRVLAAWAQLTDRARGIKAGEYLLAPGISPDGLIDLFNSGKVLLHGITFIEGTTFAEARDALSRHPAVQVTLASATPEELMAALDRPGVPPEGQFFPDTYHFPRGTSDREILTIAMRRMQDELARAWENRAPELPLEDPYEALILASIIEKETALESERPLIAGVFVRRLKLGMRLQSDPTVIYGLGQDFDGDIRRRDLRADTPWNTYTRAGLPPTPIALPGAESLAAAVRPSPTDALYFVATGEEDGSHYFSKTLAEHEAAVRRYLRKIRAR